MTDSTAADAAVRAGATPPTATVTALLPAVALGTVLVLDVLRVWMPSVIFVYGRAGSTPATTMGLFALAWVVVGLLAAALVRFVTPRTAVLATGGVLAAARLVLQLWDGGGDVQLLAASVGWVAAMAFLGAVAAGNTARRVAGAGLAVGVVGDAALRAAARSVEVTWIGGLAGTIAGVALVGAFVAALLRARRGFATDRPDTPPGPGWPWLAVGPLLVLYGVLAGTPGRVVAATGVAPTAAAMLTVAALGLGAAWALTAPALPALPNAAAVALLLVVGTVAAAPASGWIGVAGHVLLAVAIGGALGVLTGVAGEGPALRRSLAAAGGLALLFVVGFLYYAAYDLPLGVSNRVVLVATAVLIGAVVLLAGRRGTPAPPLTAGRPLVLGLALVVLLAGAGTATGAGTANGTAGGDGFPVRVMLYNVHMGFDTAGRFDTDALAAVIAEQDADVVVLNEADRGWFLNGSHDVLQLLADELGMAYVFAPAADEIWGNAVLSRYPIVASWSSPLPRGGAPMARSFVAARIAVGGGQVLGVIGTHLHHVDGDEDVRTPQAEAVAAEAERLMAAGEPVVVMGDMNAEPGDPELRAYEEAGLHDAVTPLGDVLTYPSWRPVEHIDHVFVSPDLAASDLAVPRSEASDHLAVAVTLDLR